MKKFIYTLALAIMSLGISAQTVVDIVVNSDDHTTLETAVIQADLAGTLSGPGPFTVFAPTDAAFDALPAGTLDALLADPEGALTDVLLYHVVSGNILSTDLNDGDTAPTLLGPNINVGVDMMMNVTINGVNVTVANLTASNGVVHVIDAVLTPPTVVDVVVDSPDHETLEAAVVAADLATTLSGDGPFTVFAPTDDAFDALPAGLLDALLADPTGALTDVLLYHVVGANALSTDLNDGDALATLLGPDVNVTIMDGNVMINDATVTVADVIASNGTVHVIDAVLTPPTVVDIVVDSPDHETLEAAVVAADLATTLSGDGPFTVFAPTDDAFDALPAGVLDALLADPTGDLANVLLYHVVGANALAGDLNDGDALATLLGPDVNVSIMDGTVMINGATVVVADIIAANGVVHVIDAVLTPPTVVDIVVDSPDHETLETAVIAADLAGTLSGDGPFTLFAPTDDAFAALPAGALDALLADPTGALADVLLYHAVAGQALSTDLMDGDMIETILGDDVEVSIVDGDVFINGAQVIVADILAENGVVHVIDAVLLPPVTVVDIIVDSPDHETLETAVIAADLVGALSGDGPFTVFAPTDDAFAALPAGVLDALLADPTGALADVLLYHVVGANALAGDLNDGDALATLLGPDVNVSIMDGTVMINGAAVVVQDLVADNGVVHVIDAVLTPPTIVDIVVDSPDHETLETAVIAAELAGTLSGDGPFTLFAPTDDAFAALPAGALDALLADPTGELADVLLYHAVAGQALSTDLNDGDMIETILGDDVEVSITDGNVFINGAQVIVADILASNGVVHVIDAVLLPPTTVVDIIVDSPDHETLETAVIAAELVDALSGDGPFTVFAPTDDAFAALPAGVLDALLADPTGALADVLLYHVVAGNTLAGDLNDGDALATLLGPNVNVSIMGGTVMINDAEVIVQDLVADNGVVHVIDVVLTAPTVYDIIANSDVHNTLETAIDLAGLDGTLSADGTFTVFAPTDAAFAALDTEVLDDLLADPSGSLTDVLLYHVIGSVALEADLNDGDAIETLLVPEEVVISISGGVVSINGVATVVISDILASNGVVHVIDGVLTPPTNVEVTEFGADLNVYPNPAVNQITVEGELPVNARMNITDASGRIIMSDNFFGSRTVDVSTLESGMYFLSFRTENAVAVRTFIVK
jgi:uncharacterized surface protein with fasciclin (FAS1) repeats